MPIPYLQKPIFFKIHVHTDGSTVDVVTSVELLYLYCTPSNEKSKAKVNSAILLETRMCLLRGSTTTTRRTQYLTSDVDRDARSKKQDCINVSNTCMVHTGSGRYCYSFLRHMFMKFENFFPS